MGRCVKITETVSGTPAVKQFVWCGNERCEERDNSSAVTRQFFISGEKISGTNYYFDLDHLGSVRELTNSSGTIVWQQSFSPWGMPTSILSSRPADFGYAGMYKHERSGMNLTYFRAYKPDLGRWISRDPFEEEEGPNLYAYVNNHPLNWIDPLGLQQTSAPSLGNSSKWDGRATMANPNPPMGNTMAPAGPGTTNFGYGKPGKPTPHPPAPPAKPSPSNMCTGVPLRKPVLPLKAPPPKAFPRGALNRSSSVKGSVLPKNNVTPTTGIRGRNSGATDAQDGREVYGEIIPRLIPEVGGPENASDF